MAISRDPKRREKRLGTAQLATRLEVIGADRFG